MSQRVCAHVCQKNLRSKLINWDCGTAASQIQHDLSRDTILSHWIHKENRNPSLTALSSGSPVNSRSTKRLFDSCSVPSSKKHESANLLNTSMWKRVSSNGLQTQVLCKCATLQSLKNTAEFFVWLFTDSNLEFNSQKATTLSVLFWINVAYSQVRTDWGAEIWEVSAQIWSWFNSAKMQTVAMLRDHQARRRNDYT